MTGIVLILALLGHVHAAEPPYYLQESGGRRDVGGLNENFRATADAKEFFDTGGTKTGAAKAKAS